MAQNGNPRLALIGLSRTRPWSSQMVGSEYSRLSSLFAASSPAVPGVPIVEGGAKLESGKEIWRKRSRQMNSPHIPHLAVPEHLEQVMPLVKFRGREVCVSKTEGTSDDAMAKRTATFLCRFGTNTT